MPEVCSKLSEGEEDFASCPNISIDYGIMEKQIMSLYNYVTLDGLIWEHGVLSMTFRQKT